MEEHPVLGERVLRGAQNMEHILKAVLHHHERFDGKGYPVGLSGQSIPQLARILAVSDAFDAMTSTRPYRRRLSVEEALAEVERLAGQQFDPVVADAFVRYARTALGSSSAEEGRSRSPVIVPHEAHGNAR